LFEQINGKLALTVAGERAVETARRIETEVGDLVRATVTSVEAISRSVRVIAPPIMVNHILVIAARKFTRIYPDINLELVASQGDLNTDQQLGDIAICFADNLPEEKALARRMGKLRYAAYYKKQENLEQLPWITFEQGMHFLPQVKWINGQVEEAQNTVSSIRVSDSETVLRCVEAGLGKSLLPCVIGDSRDGLQKIANLPKFSREIWMITQPGQYHVARIQIVCNWLNKTMKILDPSKKKKKPSSKKAGITKES